MKALKLILLCILAMGLSACGGEKAELPAPGALFEEIQTAAQLPKMIDVAAEMLETNTGIAPDEYTEAVYYILEEGMSPEEIIIIQANDTASAAAIEEKLQSWLAYREQAAQLYLTEYLPLIQNGIIRCDGLTVSFVVSEKADEIVGVYDAYR